MCERYDKFMRHINKCDECHEKLYTDWLASGVCDTCEETYLLTKLRELLNANKELLIELSAH